MESKEVRLKVGDIVYFPKHHELLLLCKSYRHIEEPTQIVWLSDPIPEWLGLIGKSPDNIQAVENDISKGNAFVVGNSQDLIKAIEGVS